MSGFGWSVFADGWITSGRQERFTEGVEAFIHLYYAEYGDADEIDGTTLGALRTLCEGDVDPLEEVFDDLVARVESEIADETGRTFKSTQADTDPSPNEEVILHTPTGVLSPGTRVSDGQFPVTLVRAFAGPDKRIYARLDYAVSGERDVPIEDLAHLRLTWSRAEG